MYSEVDGQVDEHERGGDDQGDPWTMIRSRWRIESTSSRPTPGTAKSVSTSTAPLMMAPICRPTTVISENELGRRAWRNRMRDGGRPLARAIVIESCWRVPIMSARSSRV